MLIFYALPLAAMLLRSVAEPGWTLDNFRRLGWRRGLPARVVDHVADRVRGDRRRAAAGLSRRAGDDAPAPGAASLVLVIVLLPFWTSVLVRSYAWMVLLGRKGLINEVLHAAGLIDAPLKLLNTSLAVHVAMIHILLPYMILPIASVLRQIDPALPRAAAGLGATPGSVFVRVISAAIDAGRGSGRAARVRAVAGILHHARSGWRPARLHVVDADRAAGGFAELALRRLLFR